MLMRSVWAAVVWGFAVVVGASCVLADTKLNQMVLVADGEAFQLPAQVLSEEIAKRSGVMWPVVAVSEPAAQKITFRAAEPTDEVPDEGFCIATEPGKLPSITITAQRRRGAMFAVGYLLRQLECSPGQVNMRSAINTTQTPDYAIRGHQLGYRAQANSYDAWDAKTFDQHIRELTFFGTNSIENIPFQDERTTPIMPLSRAEMNRVMSSICDKYDVDYWAWTPADFELTDLAKRADALKFHEAFYKDCPRLDAIFFPGGDPGDNHPREVLPFLEDLSKILPTYHPKAKIWMSLQGFEGEKTDYLFDWLKEHQPEWLGGLVAGPGSMPLPELRARLDKRYQLRDYPDITHVVRCQHPELNLDPVFAMTAGRESINPRPVFYADVFAKTAPHTNGFISYSDGCHDDVNKALWSALAWDQTQKPEAILTEYGRCFFSAADAVLIAQGILGLEQNWQGSLKANQGVRSNLQRWQSLEKSHPELATDWRWQMLLVRAYYDAYQQARLTYETQLEVEANQALEPQPGRYPTESIQEALRILAKADTSVRPEWRKRIVELFDALYTSIKFQSSVEKYHAINPQRGCMLDFVDLPLNNRYWLEDEFYKVRAMETLEQRAARLEVLRTWEKPGPGSFYDDLGHVGRSPHAVRKSREEGGGISYWWFDNGMSRLRRSWLVTGVPASLEYTDLDPAATYLLRFSGFGELKPRGDSVPLQATVYNTEMNTMKEFPVPAEMLKDGQLSVTFDDVHQEGVNWRRQPRMAEAWLIKLPAETAKSK